MIMMMMCSSSNDQWMKCLMIKKHAINEDNDNEWFEIKMSKWCQQQRQWWWMNEDDNSIDDNDDDV